MLQNRCVRAHAVRPTTTRTAHTIVTQSAPQALATEQERSVQLRARVQRLEAALREAKAAPPRAAQPPRVQASLSVAESPVASPPGSAGASLASSPARGSGRPCTPGATPGGLPHGSPGASGRVAAHVTMSPASPLLCVSGSGSPLASSPGGFHASPAAAFAARPLLASSPPPGGVLTVDAAMAAQLGALQPGLEAAVQSSPEGSSSGASALSHGARPLSARHALATPQSRRGAPSDAST